MFLQLCRYQGLGLAGDKDTLDVLFARACVRVT